MIARTNLLSLVALLALILGLGTITFTSCTDVADDDDSAADDDDSAGDDDDSAE
tara:strand:- start:141 stop:302 length:162 start_codon:yes stop_codon:yes gene_type:complete